MNWWSVFEWGILVFMLAQGLMLALAPARIAAYQLWKYRAIGARPAAPGPFTLNFYRATGIAIVAFVTFIAAKQLLDF